MFCNSNYLFWFSIQIVICVLYSLGRRWKENYTATIVSWKVTGVYVDKHAMINKWNKRWKLCKKISICSRLLQMYQRFVTSVLITQWFTEMFYYDTILLNVLYLTQSISKIYFFITLSIITIYNSKIYYHLIRRKHKLQKNIPKK